MLGVVLILNILLISPKIMPTYLEINAFDEAKYIESGRLLLEGEIRNLSWGPIVALVYAPLHLIFGNLPDWFVLEARAARILLFAFLWLSTYQLGRQLEEWINPYVLMGTLFISTGFIGVLNNQSDAVFTGFSALSLGQIFAFRRDLSLKHVWMGSLFLSLAILARFEGILLLPFYLVLCFWLDRKGKNFGKILLHSIIPILVLGSLYLLLFWLSTGSLDHGIEGKSWDSFEVNQPLPDGSSDNQAQRELTRELYGTADENQRSIIRAFQRNPGAFLQRILTNLERSPKRFLTLFGNRLGPAYLIFTMIGLSAMLVKRDWEIPGIFVLWSLQPAVSLIFLPLHFLKQLSYIPIIFTAGALSEQSVASRNSRGFSYAAITLFGLLIIYSAIDDKPAFMITGIIVFIALFIFAIATQWKMTNHSPGTLAFLLLSAGLILRPSFEFPNYPPIGQTPHEQIVYFLIKELPGDSKILSNLPLPAVAAGLQEVDPGAIPSSISSAQELHKWLTDSNILALYNPKQLKTNLDISRLLIEGNEVYFRNGFTIDNGNFEVWLVSPN